MKNLVCGIVAVAGAAASASAQVNWTTQHQYQVTAPGQAAVTVPSGGSFGITAVGTYTITVQVGIFNVTGLGAGEANHGLNNWAGRISSTGLNTGGGETLAVTNASSRLSPFNFGPATSFGGAIVGGGTGIDGNSVTAGSLIQCARAIAPSENVVWPVGGSQPQGPTDFGLSSYTNVFRFRVVVTSTDGSDIVLNAAGQAGPIIRWQSFSVVPPDPEGPTDGSINFLGVTPSPVLRDYAPTSLTLTRVPAPGAAALLGLGGLVAARRRRA